MVSGKTATFDSVALTSPNTWKFVVLVPIASEKIVAITSAFASDGCDWSSTLNGNDEPKRP